MKRLLEVIKEFAFGIIMAIAILYLLVMYEAISGAETQTGSKYEPFVVNSTAYCNPAGNKTASGKPTIEGITIAGKKEWLGCVAALYEIREDGNVGDFIGYREFTDTGYGRNSTVYPGHGTIETGETVDIYFSDRETCLRWGERRIYIQIVPGKG